MTRFSWLLALATLTLSALPGVANAQDADSDGVVDARDVCPMTVSGRAVDEAGCDAFCEVVTSMPTATDGSAFLRSRLLEVGTSHQGSFGTTDAPPAGWHPRPAGTPLGFVADPGDTGWTTYQGDFFVPGSPEEGFGMNVGGVDAFTSRLVGIQGIVGNFTGIRVECRPRICGLRGGGSVYWSGAYSGIDVDQTYSVFNGGLFILIEVSMTNTTASTQTVYYMRNVDPDNMVTVTGSFDTTNTIVTQGGPGSVALVSATTPAPNASYIALVSSDPDARVIHGGFSNRDVDGIWNCGNGTGCPVGFTGTVGAVTTSDEAISLAVRKTIAAGATETFSFVYTLSAGAIAESVACTIPAVCGDGTVEGTEVCDDGNMAAGDGCDGTCDIEPGWGCLGSPSVCDEICGDGMIVGAEGCDDANTADLDGCDSMCVVEPGWACMAAPSVCDEICGDGLVVGAEICDDGGASPTCNADCTSALCGDGAINVAGGEECDDGGETATCDADCTNVVCGDGTHNVAASEECDDGGESAACDTDCTPSMCGDDLLNATAGEACDDGNTTSDDGCSATCQSEACGNGTVEGAEECDDGAESASCDSDCTFVACGDGVANTTAGESCDDGNTADGDGCSATCEFEMPDGGMGQDAGPTLYGVSGGAVCSASPSPGPTAPGILLALLAGVFFLRRRQR